MSEYITAIERLRTEIKTLSDGLFELEEYILLPHYGGNIMLRFGLNREDVRMDELDGLEGRLYSLIPDGFLADFMGDVYRRAGMSFDCLSERLVRCAEIYAGEPILESRFAAEVRAEAAELLEKCGLPADSAVWEIQPDADGTAILLLGDRNSVIKELTAEGRKFTVLTAEKLPCEGLMRAAMFARRKGISLMSAISMGLCSGRPESAE